MILIGGTDLSIEELPLADVINYTIEREKSILAIKLKTIARQSSCLGVYLHVELKDLDGVKEIEHKIVFFTDDEHLVSLLETGGVESPPEEEEPVEEEPEIEQFSEPELPEEVEIKDDSSNEELELEDVNLELPETFLAIPNISEDSDSLSHQIELKERIIEQKDTQIRELRAEIDEIYRLQEIELLEMREQYEKQINLVNEKVLEFKEQAESVILSDGVKSFLKFATYSENYRASLRESFTDSEKQELGSSLSNLYIFATGGGDSYYSMMKSITQLMDKYKKVLIVDFSNDYYMNTRHRMVTKEHSLLLNEPDINVSTLVKDFSGVDYIPTMIYNDIGLLTLDWVTIIKKLNLYSKGQPVILLFNSISSFSVKYTVSKLATLGKLFLFAKCNPVIISNLYLEASFIPANRLTIVALDYVDFILEALQQVSKKFRVHSFKGERVEWKKLGIDL